MNEHLVHIERIMHALNRGLISTTEALECIQRELDQANDELNVPEEKYFFGQEADIPDHADWH